MQAFGNRVYSKRKEFAPRGANSYLSELTQKELGGEMKISLTVYLFTLESSKLYVITCTSIFIISIFTGGRGDILCPRHEIEDSRIEFIMSMYACVCFFVPRVMSDP